MFAIPEVGDVYCVGDAVALKANWELHRDNQRGGDRIPERLYIQAVEEGAVCVSWAAHDFDPQWVRVWDLVNWDTGKRVEAVVGLPITVTWPGHGSTLYVKCGPFFQKIGNQLEFWHDLMLDYGVLFDREGWNERLTRRYANASVEADGDRAERVCSSDGE